jgi:hypothetical protein
MCTFDVEHSQSAGWLFRNITLSFLNRQIPYIAIRLPLNEIRTGVLIRHKHLDDIDGGAAQQQSNTKVLYKPQDNPTQTDEIPNPAQHNRILSELQSIHRDCHPVPSNRIQCRSYPAPAQNLLHHSYAHNVDAHLIPSAVVSIFAFAISDRKSVV